MRAFLAAIAVAVVLAITAHWFLTTQLGWSTTQRFAAPETVRVEPDAAARRGF